MLYNGNLLFKTFLAEISFYEKRYIPKEMISFEVLVLNITNIFKVYGEGVNIENFLYIYYVSLCYLCIQCFSSVK